MKWTLFLVLLLLLGFTRPESADSSVTGEDTDSDSEEDTDSTERDSEISDGEYSDGESKPTDSESDTEEDTDKIAKASLVNKVSLNPKQALLNNPAQKVFTKKIRKDLALVCHPKTATSFYCAYCYEGGNCGKSVTMDRASCPSSQQSNPLRQRRGSGGGGSTTRRSRPRSTVHARRSIIRDDEKDGEKEGDSDTFNVWGWFCGLF